MKKLSFLLALLVLLQACSAYHSRSVSAEEAVAAEKKVKVITAGQQKYKFKRLEQQDGRLLGITRLGSPTAKKLVGMPNKIDGKYLEVDLSNVEIDKIRLLNKSGSISLTAISIAGLLLLTFFTVFLISFANDDFWTYEGTE